MRPRLGLPSLTMLVIASMIGVGAFVSSGFALESLGSPGRILLAWGLCGLWAMTGAIAYGGLAARVPLSGGEYLYLSRLLHPSIGFLAGWISLVAGFTAPIAAMAKAFVQNALPMFSDAPTSAAVVACIVIAIACVCHAVGLGFGAWAQNAIVFIKLAFIGIFATWALMMTSGSAWQGGVLPNRAAQLWPSDGKEWLTLAAAMSWISFSFAGFNASIYVAGEARDAERLVPRAMWLGTCLVTIIYMILNGIFVYAAPASEVLGNKPAIAAIAARSLGGSAMDTLMRAIIALAVLSSVFSMLLAGPRVYSQMASDGVMPAFLKNDHGVPRVALVMQALLSMIVVWSATLDQIIGYLGMTLSACSALAVAALWQSSRYRDERKPPSHANAAAGDTAVDNVSMRPIAWWESASACIYIAGTIIMLTAVLIEGGRRMELVAVLATFVIGLVIYFVWSMTEPRAGSA